MELKLMIDKNFQHIRKEVKKALKKLKPIGVAIPKNEIVFFRNDGLNILFINYDTGVVWENNIGFSLRVNYISRIVGVGHFNSYHSMAALSNPSRLATVYSFEYPFVAFENKEQITQLINSYIDSAIYYINCFDAIINKHSLQGIMYLLNRFNENLSAPKIYATAVLYGLQNEAQKGIKILEEYLQNEIVVHGKVSKVEEDMFVFLIKQLNEKTHLDFLEFAKNSINDNYLDKSYTQYEKNFNLNIEQKTQNPIEEIGGLIKPQHFVAISKYEKEIENYLSHSLSFDYSITKEKDEYLSSLSHEEFIKIVKEVADEYEKMKLPEKIIRDYLKDVMLEYYGSLTTEALSVLEMILKK